MLAAPGADNIATPVRTPGGAALRGQPGARMALQSEAAALVFASVLTLMVCVPGVTLRDGDGFTRAVVDAENASDPGPLVALLDRYRVTWAIMPPAQHSATLLGLAPGWAELHRDGVVVVFAKRP